MTIGAHHSRIDGDFRHERLLLKKTAYLSYRYALTRDNPGKTEHPDLSCSARHHRSATCVYRCPGRHHIVDQHHHTSVHQPARLSGFERAGDIAPPRWPRKLDLRL